MIGLLYIVAGFDNSFYILQNLSKHIEKHVTVQNYAWPHKILRGRIFSDLFSKIYLSTFWKLENTWPRKTPRGHVLIKKHKRFAIR